MRGRAQYVGNTMSGTAMKCRTEGVRDSRSNCYPYVLLRANVVANKQGMDAV